MPAEVTLADPFTAQGSIATDVAQAMEVAALSVARVQLTRRFTDSPQAFAAYQREQAIFEKARSATVINPEVSLRAIRELNRAITLDSNFAEAWVHRRQRIGHL